MKSRTLLAVAAVAVASFAVACVPDPPPYTPTTTTTAAPDPWAPPQCWESVDPSTVSLAYFGPENTLDNAAAATRGNNCASLVGPRTVVRAPDQATANALCNSLKGTNAGKLTEQNVNPPADGWRCF